MESTQAFHTRIHKDLARLNEIRKVEDVLYTRVKLLLSRPSGEPRRIGNECVRNGPCAVTGTIQARQTAGSSPFEAVWRNVRYTVCHVDNPRESFQHRRTAYGTCFLFSKDELEFIFNTLPALPGDTRQLIDDVVKKDLSTELSEANDLLRLLRRHELLFVIDCIVKFRDERKKAQGLRKPTSVLELDEVDFTVFGGRQYHITDGCKFRWFGQKRLADGSWGEKTDVPTDDVRVLETRYPEHSPRESWMLKNRSLGENRHVMYEPWIEHSRPRFQDGEVLD